jgi:hypothetical protein
VRVAGVMINDEADIAIGLPVAVEFEATKDPDIVIPRWKVTGTADNAWKFTE